MKRRIIAFALIVLLAFGTATPALACDEQQSEYYILRMMFGDQWSRYQYEKDDKDIQIILNGLYICSMQSDQSGSEQLKKLKKSRVKGIPNLKQVNIPNEGLFDCSHNLWENTSKKNHAQREIRKKILRNSVMKVFNFGWFNETFKGNKGKIDSFSALLYYCHILADYLADDPLNTRVSAKGYDIPPYSGEEHYELNKGVPSFTRAQKKETDSYKEYSDFDCYKRCGAATTVIGNDTFQSIRPRNESQMRAMDPTGWNQTTYSGIMPDGEYLYNRCHLVAHSLGGIDTAHNLITGTRYLNEAMEPYEKEITEYIRNNKDNHVLYRVTPVYSGANNVASGVQLEAYSLEDNGKGVSFNVYCYNVQPGVKINYSNGNSELEDLTVDDSNILPFAISGANDINPDLMFAIRKHLSKLFADQAQTDLYSLMINKLNQAEIDARNIKADVSWKYYQKIKPYQHQYMEILCEYIPKLLQNERFFKSKF